MSDRFPGLKFIAFGVIAVLCAAWLVQQTGNVRFFASEHTYTASVSDVSGLVAQDSVLLSGVRVGTVKDISIERGNALVTFTADADVELRDTWEVGARWRNVTGQRYFYIYPTGDGAVLEPEAHIPLERSRSVADIGLFFERLTPLLRAINPEQQNQVVEALNTALAGQEERTQQLVEDLGSLSNTLADQDEKISRVLTQGDRFLTSYNERQDDIRAFFDNFAEVSQTLARRDEELVAALTDISDVQEELESLIERNDSNIEEVLDQLEVITGTVSDNRAEFENALATAKDGLAVYMTISRWGQWFNVRAVAVQVQNEGNVILCRTEANAECSMPNSRPPGESDSQTSLNDLPTRASYTRAPSRLDGAAAIVGTALGDRPGAGLVYARDHMIDDIETAGGVR